VIAAIHSLHTMATLWTLLVAPSLQERRSLCIETKLSNITETVGMGNLSAIRADISHTGWACEYTCSWRADTRIYSTLLCIRLCPLRQQSLRNERRACRDRTVKRPWSRPLLILSLKLGNFFLAQVWSCVMQMNRHAAFRWHACQVFACIDEHVLNTGRAIRAAAVSARVHSLFVVVCFMFLRKPGTTCEALRVRFLLLLELSLMNCKRGESWG
jgi:hypothetical protein